MVREAKQEDLAGVLELYLCLHEKSLPELSEHLTNMGKRICYRMFKFCKVCG